ncbi:MAG: hypothetical protein PHE24_00925 [Patescibacteria group bacterium]|nr:hypothetical protein [Patescibacteria group bacterium]
MNKKVILIIVGALVLLGISAFIAIKYSPNIFVIPHKNITGQTKATSTEIDFFFRSDCPHCLIVEQFLADNNVGQKIKIDKKQVFANKVTPESELLSEKANQCGINPYDVGVPFIWDGPTGKCYMGDQDAINYFQQKLKQ